MALYEHIFLARQDISAAQVDNLVEQFKGILSENGGTVAKVENWGLRTTTYRIKKNRKAHFVLMNVDAPSSALNEMERQMRINDDILRYITIRVEAHDEEPSAMMRKNDRDDRPPRGGPGGRDGGRDDRPPRAPQNREPKPETKTDGE